MTAERFIEQLTLSKVNYPKRSRASTPYPTMATRTLGLGTADSLSPSPAPPAAIPANLQAAVNVGSLLSFVEGVSAQEKDDILFSVQLAQRGASGAFDRYRQVQSWYQKYTEILEQLGWATEQLAFTQLDQSEGNLRMDKAALAIITAIATQNQLAVLTQAVKALESMAEADNAIQLFDFHTATQTSGNFQIGAVQKAPNDALALALGAFHFHNADARRKFLFFAWGERNVSFWTAAQKMTLNTTHYALHRDTVRRKLGLAAAEFIEALPLG